MPFDKNSHFDNFEIQSLCPLGKNAEPCDPKYAKFWGVFVHFIPRGVTGGVMCIADCTTKDEAEHFTNLLCSILQIKPNLATEQILLEKTFTTLELTNAMAALAYIEKKIKTPLPLIPNDHSLLKKYLSC